MANGRTKQRYQDSVNLLQHHLRQRKIQAQLDHNQSLFCFVVEHTSSDIFHKTLAHPVKFLSEISHQ